MELTQVVDLGAVRLNIGRTGAGPRRVLAVHGFTGAKEDFGIQLEAMAARGCEVVAPDLRGHGSSSHPAGQQSYQPADMVEDLVGLMDALGWPSAVVVGHSMGGALAQAMAVTHPGRVEALVLASTFHRAIESLDPQLVALGSEIVRQQGMSGLAVALDAHRAGDPAARASRSRLEAAEPGYQDRKDRQLRACSPEMWLSMAPRFCSWPDILEDLRALAVPTLVVVGSEDEAMIGQCRTLAEAIPGARLEVIAGAGHSPQLEAADAWAHAVGSFLASLGPVGPGAR